MKGIFSVLVENKDGVLSQISGLFARRAFNIDSLAVGVTERKDISSMTIVSTGDQRTIDQIEKHLNKKLDVIKVRRLEETKCVLLEMMLMKVSYSQTNRASLIELCSVMGAKIVHVSAKNMVIEFHAAPDEVENFIELARSFGILELQSPGTRDNKRKTAGSFRRFFYIIKLIFNFNDFALVVRTACFADSVRHH